MTVGVFHHVMGKVNLGLYCNKMFFSNRSNLRYVLRDPWEDAALSLSHKDKTSIALSGPAPNLDEVLNCVDDAKREFRRKQWRIHSGANKEAIFLRDIYDKIAVWIQRFVDMVDVAVQYDPGHAALPWASIRFLLKASVNNVEKAKLVVEGVERVSNLIFWCDIQKKLHLYRSSSTATRLQLALTKLCSAMLRFLAKAIRFYKKSTAGEHLSFAKYDKLEEIH